MATDPTLPFAEFPELEPGQCGSCLGTRRPLTNGRCDLCAAAFGPASEPVLIRDLLWPALANIEDVQRAAGRLE
jgi:hypothetical protein